MPEIKKDIFRVEDSTLSSRRELLQKRIRQARGLEPADLVIRGAKIVNVLSKEIQEGDVAVCDGIIVGIGAYEGRQTAEVSGYLVPGLTDSHIHIESSMLTPAEFSRIMITRGVTSVIADPHEIMNVAGTEGLHFMQADAEKAVMDIFFMMASCVPATPWEHSGAVVRSGDMRTDVNEHRVTGLGEMMDFPGVLRGDPDVLDKLLLAGEAGVITDGHSPGLAGKDLSAYIAAGISTDHECSAIEEMQERIRLGMYVQLRYGSACIDLPVLAGGITKANVSRCLLCSDDIQPVTILGRGAVDAGIKLCISRGIDPIDAVSMATINAAQCYGLRDRGAIAPGLIADLVLTDDLQSFKIRKVWKRGILAAEDGECVLPKEKRDASIRIGSMNIGDFSEEKLKLHLRSDRVRTIGILPGGVLTKAKTERVRIDQNGDFIYDSSRDVVRISVIERHHGTGNTASALLSGYGMKRGAIAVSVAHDSHNIITAGTNTKDMYTAVSEVARMGGGMAAVLDQKVLAEIELPVGGLMTSRNADYVISSLYELERTAQDVLGVRRDIEPVMVLCFMALPVIPELKITDKGLFDVRAMQFTDVSIS